MQREIIHLTGRVQGVGFRAHVSHLAQRFLVTGSVRNLRADRSLEIDVEGEPEEIERFLQAVLAQPPIGGHVDAVLRRKAEPIYPTSFQVSTTSDAAN